MDYAFKASVSLKKYAEHYKAERIEEACRQILTFSGEPSIRGLSILLKSPVGKKSSADQAVSSHSGHRSRGITRGADQFRRGGDEQ